MKKEFVWTDAEVKKILHAATGNIKDFVMDNDGFLESFKASHSDRGWEIESFIGPHRNIWQKDLAGNYGYYDINNRKPYCSSLKWMLSVLGKGFHIHSVRRLSDDSIWTVGDDTPKGKIKQFELPHPDGQLYVRYDLGGWDYLSQATELPKRTKLFIAEDGVIIYEGDTYWTVEPQSNYLTYFSGGAGPWSGKNKYRLHFSTESAAKEYVILKKPCLSVPDILALWCLTDHPRKQIIELAKSKQTNL